MTQYVSLVGAATSMIFVMTKVLSCQHVLVACLMRQTCVCCSKTHDKTHVLSRQKYACRDKTFATTNISLLQQIFVMTNIILLRQVLSRQAYFCSDKTHLLSWQKYACHDKHVFVATYICVYVCVLSQQKYFVMTNIILSWQNKHTFVTTNMCLPWQKFCCDKYHTCGSSRQW